MSEFYFNTAKQGWQCPICGRVYAPITMMCQYCGDETAQRSITTDIDITGDTSGTTITAPKISTIHVGEEKFDCHRVYLYLDEALDAIKAPQRHGDVYIPNPDTIDIADACAALANISKRDPNF